MSRSGRRWLLIALLFLLVLGLSLLALWPSQREEPSPLLSGYDPERISRVSVRYGDLEMQFERREGRWWMVSPYLLPASRPNLERLLALPREKVRRSYRPGEVDLAELGLAPPKATVSLDGIELRFGRQHPLELLRYVEVGDRIALIDDTHFFLLTTPPTYWLDHRLVPEGQITGLKLPGLELSQTEKGGFQSRPPREEQVLRELVAEWQSARAIEITPASATPPKGAPEIVVSTDRGAIRFLLLARAPELVLLREGVNLRYHLLPEMAQKLGLSDAGTPRSGDPPPQP